KAVREELAKVVKRFPNPFQSYVNSKTSSIYNLVTENVKKPISNILGSVPAPTQPLVSIFTEQVTNNPVVNAAVKVAKKGFFSFADTIRGMSTVLVGVLTIDKQLSSLKRKPEDDDKVNDADVSKQSSLRTYLPAIGIVGGTLVGTIASIWHNQSIYEKGSMLCSQIESSHHLSNINLNQQMVTKALGFGYNLIPGFLGLASTVGVTAYKYLSGRNVVEKKESKELLGRAAVDLAKTGVMSAIAMGFKQVLKWNKASFDPSGHIMLRAAGLHGLLVSQKYINDPMTKAATTLFGLYSVVTDGVFLAKTAGCFHTPLDIVAGTVYALGTYTLANSIVDQAVNFIDRKMSFIPKAASGDVYKLELDNKNIKPEKKVKFDIENNEVIIPKAVGKEKKDELIIKNNIDLGEMIEAPKKFNDIELADTYIEKMFPVLEGLTKDSCKVEKIRKGNKVFDRFSVSCQKAINKLALLINGVDENVACDDFYLDAIADELNLKGISQIDADKILTAIVTEMGDLLDKELKAI
nr:hypothetical protein [Parachlamydiaceae bacterium]